jgi:hypothetical protein
MSFSLDGHGHATSGSGSVSSLGVSIPVLAGDWVGVWVAYDPSTTTITVADNVPGNGAYNATSVANSSNFAGGIWWVIATTSTTITITATPNVSSILSIAAASFTCAGTPVVGNHNFGSSVTSPVSSGNVSFPGAGNWLLFGGGSCNAAASISLTTTLDTVGSFLFAVTGYTANLTSSSSPQAASISCASNRLAGGMVAVEEVISSGGPFPWFVDQSMNGGFWSGGY